MAFTPGSGAVISFSVEGTQEAERKVSSFGKSIGDLSTVAKSSLAGLAAFAGFGLTLGELTKQVIDSQREFDKLSASLETATGSSKSAGEAFEALRAFAANTPYDLKQTTEAFLELRNLGLTPSERALTSFGNTAAAKSKDLKDVVEAVADAATGEFDRLKDAFGITSQQIGDNVAFTFQGTTTIVEKNAKDIEEYLTKIGEVQFGGAMERQAQTLNGAIGQLGDTWDGVMRTIATNGIGAATQSAVLALSNSLQDLANILEIVGGKATEEGGKVKESAALHASLTFVFQSLAITGVYVVAAFKEIGQELGALGAVSALAVKGDLAGIKAVMKARYEDANQLSNWVSEKTKAIAGYSQNAAAAQQTETQSVGKGTKDRLAQYAIELTTDQKRAKAKQDIADIEKRLTGVDPQTTADLKKLKEALDAGAISQAQYAKYTAKIKEEALKNSTTYKDQIKNIDLSTEAIKRKSAALALSNEQEQAQLEFLRRTGQISEEDFISKGASKDVKLLQDQKKGLEEQLALAKRKQDSQKEQGELAAQIDQTEQKITARKTKEGNDLFELEQQRYRLAVNNSADLTEKDQAELASLKQQTQAQIDQNEQIGLTTKQVAALTAQRLEEAAARKDAEAYTAEGMDLTGDKAQLIRDQAKAIRERAAAIVDGAAKQELYNKNIEDLRALVDIMSALDEATQSAAQGMTESFGTVGSAIGGLTTAMSAYGKTQAVIAAQLATATKDAGGDQTKIQRANMMAAEASAQAQVKSYGDMASAAKDFFGENTAGYKVMQGAEKAFRAYEMAMALESTAKKILFKETEVAANTTLNATKLTGEAAASAASTGLAATEASAWGITAVVKAIASLPFPLNLAAGAATLAAVVAVGAKMVGSIGGSSISLSEQRQAAQGTGTVLGNSSAKSESISRAIELSASNSSTQINYLAGMLTSLRSIQSGISSFASQVVQTSGITGDTAGETMGSAASFASSALGVSAIVMPVVGNLLDTITGGWLSKTLGKVANSIFGGNTSVVDTGFTMTSGSLASILASGATASQYTETKKDGGWFHSDKYSTSTTPLSAEANVQFNAIIKSLSSSISEAGDLLGLSGDEFTAKLNSFVVDIGEVSLKDMTSDEIQDALEAVFSKLGDDMAAYAVTGLQQFQEVGEGYLETLVRVASDYAKVDASLQSIGMTFGAVGLESVKAREDLIALMGGIDEFQSETAGFASNFLTKAEQLAPVAKYVDEQLAALGLTGITTRDQFKEVVLGLDLTTAAGQKEYAALMDLQEAFAATHAATVDLSKTEQEIADEKQDLQDQLDELTMTQAQLAEKARYALAEVNRPLYDMVQAAQKLADASSSLTKFRDAALSLSNSLTTGSLSTLTPEAQEAELYDQYQKLKAAALAGDTTAQDQVFSAMTAWLTASQTLNSGDSTYQADYAEAQQDAAALASWASDQVDVAQAQLTAMNSQTEQLDSANAALEAANKILETIAQNTAPVPTQATSVVDSALSVLAEAVNTLQTEVAGLRSDQQGQTGDTITSNAEVLQQTTQAIVAAVSKVSSALASNQKVTLE